MQATDAREIGVFDDGATGTTIVICALDNLGKGAAGQAVQNANLALGLAETLGLRLHGVSYERDRREGLRSRAGSRRASGYDARRRRGRPLAVPRSAAAMFTRNKVQAACLQVNRAHLAAAEPQAVVVNSGVANAATGAQGFDARRNRAEHAARLLGLAPEQVLVLSTGVIGVQLPLDRLLAGVDAAVAALSPTAAATPPRRS